MSNKKNSKENDLQKKFEATLELALRQNRDEFLKKKQSAEHETSKKEPSEKQSKSDHKKMSQNQ